MKFTDVKRPELVKTLLEVICKQDAFICGGFARVVCSPNAKPIPSEDIDIYLYNKDSFNILAKRLESIYYIKSKENDVSCVFTYVVESDTLHPLINLIKPIESGHLHTFGEIDNILNNFDFTIARCGVYLNSDNEIKARCDNDFENDERDHVLRIKNIHCPIAEVNRICKYTKRGYKIPLMEIVKCFMDWEERDDNYRQELVEALEAENLTNEDKEALYKRLYVD